MGVTVAKQASLFGGKPRISKDEQIGRDRASALSYASPNPYENESFASKNHSLVLQNLKSGGLSNISSQPVSQRKGNHDILQSGNIQVSNQRKKNNLGNLEIHKAESQQQPIALGEQKAKDRAPEQYTLRKLETVGDYFNDYKDGPGAKQQSLKDLHETTEVRIHKKQLMKGEVTVESSFNLANNNGQASQERLDGTLEIPSSMQESKAEIAL